MRLPGWDVYRAFSELDAFSDAQCREYVKLSWRKHRLLMMTMVLIELVLGVVGLFGLMVATILASEAVRMGSHRDPPEWLTALVTIVTIAVVAGAVALAMLLTRDVMLRRAVRKQLKSVKCHRCAYSLLGLQAREGVVTCPECGFRLALEKYGLTSRDFVFLAEWEATHE